MRVQAKQKVMSCYEAYDKLEAELDIHWLLHL